MAGRTVATRYVPKVVTVPANTAASAPQSTPVALGQVTLMEWQLIVPTGHSGLTGVAIEYAGTRIVPWDDKTAWIIANGATLGFDVEFDVSAPLVVAAYNTDALDHSFHMRFKVIDWPTPQAKTAVSLVAL